LAAAYKTHVIGERAVWRQIANEFRASGRYQVTRAKLSHSLQEVDPAQSHPPPLRGGGCDCANQSLATSDLGSVAHIEHNQRHVNA
jgi:hypothetical protein